MTRDPAMGTLFGSRAVPGNIPGEVTEHPMVRYNNVTAPTEVIYREIPNDLETVVIATIFNLGLSQSVTIMMIRSGQCHLTLGRIAAAQGLPVPIPLCRPIRAKFDVLLWGVLCLGLNENLHQ